ncbi:Monomeric sarcosine oxidase [compost metagenome]
MPGAAGRLLKGSVCKYEHTPDEDFIIDRHPLHSNVLLAGGFSGHGFKFSSVVGEILADLTTRGATRHNIQPFSLSRFTPPHHPQAGLILEGM